MVNVRRTDPLLNREFSFREGRVRRREIIRQRLIRDRPPVVRQLFIDRDEISDDILRAFNDREETPFELSFASLSPENNLEVVPISTEEESEEEDIESTTGYSDTLSNCPTVEIDLDDTDVRIPLALLRGWERNAEIRPLVSCHTQTSPPITSPGSPPSYSDYSSPNYSPVRLEDLEDLEHCNLDYVEPIFSEAKDENLIDDDEINRLLNYIDDEDFFGNEL